MHRSQGNATPTLVQCFILFGTYLAATFAKLLPVAPKEAPLKYPSSGY